MSLLRIRELEAQLVRRDARIAELERLVVGEPYDESKVMRSLAERITSSSHPDDPRLYVAYAIARYLNLSWPSAYDVEDAFDRIDQALTGCCITVEEEATFKYLRAMLAATPKDVSL